MLEKNVRYFSSCIVVPLACGLKVKRFKPIMEKNFSALFRALFVGGVAKKF